MLPVFFPCMTNIDKPRKECSAQSADEGSSAQRADARRVLPRVPKRRVLPVNLKLHTACNVHFPNLCENTKTYQKHANFQFYTVFHKRSTIFSKISIMAHSPPRETPRNSAKLRETPRTACERFLGVFGVRGGPRETPRNSAKLREIKF